MYVGKRNDLTGLINSHEHEARFGYPLVHLSIGGGLQVEEGLAEGGHLDVRGFVLQAQPHSRGVGIIQPSGVTNMAKAVCDSLVNTASKR